MKKMVHIQRNLGELYRGRTAMGLKYIVAGLSVMAKSDVSARNSLHITPSVYPPYRTHSAKYQSIWTDLRALSAIFVFQSLNKLGPLVANFKISCMNSAYSLQDQLSQVSAHLD